MVDTYREKATLMPRNLTLIAAAVFVATLVCMIFVRTARSPMPTWALPACAVVFVIAILFMWMAELDVEVSENGVRVRYLWKEYEFPRDDILDKRYGELADIKNYSNWNLKGVKHRNFTRVGEDDGVAIKLKGKRVVVISSKDAQTMYGLVPLEILEEEE